MRLGVNATILGNQRPTGVENVAVNLINNWSRLTDTMVVWTVNDSLLDPGRNLVVKVLQGANSLCKGRISAVRAVWDQLVFPRLVKNNQIDVVFFPVQEGMLFPPAPQVVLLIDMAPLLNHGGVPFLRKLSYLTRVPFVLSRCSAIVTISHSVKKQMLEKYPHLDEKKVHVMHLGYDSSRFNRSAMDPAVLGKYGLREVKYVSYVGSINRNKNIHTIIASYSECRCPEYDLVIAGKVLDPGYYRELVDLVKKHGLVERVKFIDYVGYQDLPALYCGSSLFLFPSLYEGFGLPILEAMACGVPVVTSDRYSMPEVAGEAAILVDPEDPGQLAQAIREVLSNPATRNALVCKGLERVESFSWEKAAHQAFEICADAAAGRASRR